MNQFKMTKCELIQQVHEILDHWLICKESWGEFKAGEFYWISLLESGEFYGRSDNIKDRILNLPVGILLSKFEVTERMV